MPKILSDNAYKTFVAEWQAKLTAAQEANAQLLRDKYSLESRYKEKITALELALRETKVTDERAQYHVLKAREDARNAKERGKRLQRRIARLEQELMEVKKNR